MRVINPRKQKIFTILFVLMSLPLLAFNARLRWVNIAELNEKLMAEEVLVEMLRDERESILNPDIKEAVLKLREGVYFADVLLSARDEVFSGTEDERLVILDFLKFFEKFKELLAKKTVVSNLSVDPSGGVSFLLQTTSYYQAAKQMEVLKYGFGEDPALFVGLQINSVGRRELVGMAEEFPQVLRDEPAVYSFIVQARLNELAPLGGMPLR